MKTLKLLLAGLFVVAGFAAIASFAADEFSHSYIAHVNVVRDGSDATLLADGDSAMTVMSKLGQPHQMLSKSVWLYLNFRASAEDDAARHFADNLVIAFGPGKKLDDRKVTTIVMANDRGVRKIENGLKQNPNYLEDMLIGY